MSQCPSTVQLEQMLAEKLTSPEHESVEAHVETCVSCQERLELLAGSTIDAASPRGSRRLTDSLPEPDDDFLRRLRLTPPPSPLTPAPVPTAWAPVPREELRAQAASDRPGLGRLGQYELLEQVGRGGMGAVYKARHCALGKVVALKVLPVELRDELTIARFKNEMRAVGKLEHPNIVGAHDAGQVDGRHFLVMEFIDGIDLAGLVQRQGGLRVADACELIRQAAVGLQHAYEHGLIHRDIKPSNLMLARNGLVKVLDLGLARSLGDAPSVERLTATGQVLGTADYIAPEQCEAAHTADSRADIYSLGCTLYHLLAGTPPFGGAQYTSWLQKMKAHLETPVPPLRQWRPEVPEELVAVLDRLLAKNPADRFAIPAEVASALQPFTAGSDLARLLEPVATPTPQAHLATPPGRSPARAQPIPAFQQTPPPVTRRQRLLGLVRRPSVGIATLAGCGVLLAVALVLGSRLGNSPPTFKTGLPLQILAMHIHRFQGEEAQPLGEIGSASATAHLDDDVRVEVSLSTPAYCYLLAFNPDGTEQLCHPEDGDAAQAKARRPAQSAVLRYPQKERDYFGLDAVGLQAFVLVASTRPLLPYAEWRSKIGKIPWQPVQSAPALGASTLGLMGSPLGQGPWLAASALVTERALVKAAGVWRFDGQNTVQLRRERGTVRPRGGPPKPLLDLCDFFKNCSGFEAIQVLAFPVTPD